jgi:hypothetical protein
MMLKFAFWHIWTWALGPLGAIQHAACPFSRPLPLRAVRLAKCHARGADAR